MTTVYHVVRGEWDGRDLTPFVRRHNWSEETVELICKAWPDVDPWQYYCTEAHYLHLCDTVAEAKEFAEEFGGQILEIDADGLTLEQGREYPHPVSRDAIDASRVRLLAVGV